MKQRSRQIALLFLLAAFWAASGAGGGAPKTFAEKKKIAKEMKVISKELDVKCAFCHADAERGLKEGDYTLLTEEGEYAHETMFPLSKDFRVSCAYCHTGSDEYTVRGQRAHHDMKWVHRFNRDKKAKQKNATCLTCHIPGPEGEEFKVLTDYGKKNPIKYP